MRKLGIAAVVLLALLVAADRIAAAVAGNEVAQRVATSEDLSERPDVTFGGFPFLTQALAGSFRDVRVVADGVVRGELSFRRIAARLQGVEVSVRDALNGDVSAVPIRRGRAEVQLAYADLNRYLAKRRITVRADGTELLLEGFVTVAGQPLPAAAKAEVTVRPDRIAVVARDVRARGGAQAPLPAAAGAALSFDIPTAKLPFGVKVESVAVAPDALLIAASATGLVVPAS